MGRVARGLQWAGVLVVLVSAFLPTRAQWVVPTHDGIEPWASAMFFRSTPEVPAAELADAAYASLHADAPDGGPLWHTRQWYPWYLALLWCGALAWVASAAGARRRRLVGGLLWGLTLVLLLFEAAYLAEEYEPMLLGRVEVWIAWLIVAGVLLFRRRGDLALGAVEATIASQALLGFLHAMTLPSTMGRGWVGSYPLASVVEAVWHNFPPAFWLGAGGMLLAALPVYLRRRAGGS